MSYNNGDLITIGQVKTALQRVDSEITTRAGSNIDLPENDGTINDSGKTVASDEEVQEMFNEVLGL